VPRLVKRQGEESVFRGRDFRELRVERAEDAPEWIVFTLVSRPAKGVKQ
jgi:hypothetical protein